ncbi:MAG: hypothetical protein LBC39_04985 [Methanobrevibacter sp.]|jgi:predicted outer membrane repeat protein|nr:hypothetical protein [Candidatus Methanovirga aequatorialis]
MKLKNEIKKLIGFCLIFALLVGNGQFLYAFENTKSDNLSKDFIKDIKVSLNDLQSNARAAVNNIRETSELVHGLATGTTVVVGPNESYKNLKDAVINSKSGDTILLVQGNYTGMNNTNIPIDHDLKIRSLVPVKSWVTYNNTNYSHEDFCKLINSSNETSSLYNDSVEHMENATILNGGNNKMFNVEADINFELDGLFLVNGSGLKGGAINNKGNLVINDCYFDGNEVFDDNVRDQNKGGGGAIYNEGNLTLNSTDFTGNVANDYSPGGAIYNTGTINLLAYCKFNSNYADNGGGAIYNKGKITSLNKDTFTGNIANSTTSHCGGAILNEGKDSMNFNDVIFIYNSAETGGGGGVDSYSSCNFTNSTFNSNAAATHGGSLSLLNGEYLSLVNSTFDYNTAEHQGGSVYYTGGSFNSFDCNYTGNVASNDGGGLYLGSCENSHIRSNVFTMNVGDNGGAVYQDGGYINCNNNTLIFNRANHTTSNGGAIYSKNGVFNINNNTFDRNYALGSGGAIYNQNSKGLINYTTLHENLCKDNGGAIYNNHYNVSLNNCSVYNNYALGSGGAVYNDREGTNFLVNQTLFGNNTANMDGGCVCNLADSFFTYFSGFGSSKTCTGSGGAIYNDGNNIVVELSDFEYNFAQSSGGGIYNNGNAIKITNVNMTSNIAHEYGGGYYDESNNLEAQSTNFKDNIAGKSGDDYYTSHDKTAKIVGTMVGLALIMIVITAVSIIVPAATGLYGAVGAAAAAAGWSAGACSAAVYGIEALIAICSGLVFMGIEEGISSACPEFEDWNSKYWYISTIIFVACAIGTGLLTSSIAESMFKINYDIPNKGFKYFDKFVVSEDLKWVSMTAEQVVDLLGKAGLNPNASLAFVGIIAKGVGFLFQSVHLDDWIVGLILAIQSSSKGNGN